MQEKLKEEDQWASKEQVRKNSECWREFFNPQVVPTTKKHNGGHAYCERWKHFKILGKGEHIVKAKAQPPFIYIGLYKKYKPCNTSERRKEHHPWIF